MGRKRKRGRQPQRTCVVCRSKRDKGELLRFVLDGTERVYLDKRQHHRGRGAYVCPRPECLTRLKQIHLKRAFRRALSEDAWNPGNAMAEALEGCNFGL
ncbi:MAG: YlxR family protein [Deltaproteobacteria bacterium]|nr:YlxR family protein [Deltaproteobacteria bacterium]